MDNLCIIARYNEDLSWVNDLKSDYLIYNKGKEFPFDFKKTDVPNKGREAETYIRAVQENYELIKKYRTVFFVQGDPFDSNPNIVEDMNNFIYTDEVKEIATNRRAIFHNQDIFAHNKTVAIINKLSSGNLYDKIDVFQEGALKSNILAYILNIHKVPVTWWTGSAQYAVPSKNLSNKSHKWWTDTLKVIHFYEDYTNESVAHLMEHLWVKVFEYSDKIDLSDEGILKFSI